MSELATRPDDAPPAWAAIAKYSDGRENPLLMIPKDWRNPVMALWAANSHMLPSSIPVAATLRSLEGQDVTTPDVIRAVRALLTVEKRAAIRFASDLIAELCRLIAANAADRRAAAATAERRRPPDVATNLAGMLSARFGLGGPPVARAGDQTAPADPEAG